MPEPQQVTAKTVQPPNPLSSDLEDLQNYAVNLFVEKLAISLAFAILSAFIVFITALIYDVRFMTAFMRGIIAFFVSGFAAALVSNVLDMQEDYYKLKSVESQMINTEEQTTQAEDNDQTDEQNQTNSEQFKPLDKQSLPNVNNK